VIAFASFYLGLVLGAQPIELIAGDKVARVELRLDDRAVATLDGPPWRTELDFGEQLLPHDLSALAFDAAGAEVGLARQWINLPSPPAEAELLVEGVESGEGATARVAWGSLTAGQPIASRVVFDGRELEVLDPSAFELPPFDPQQLHYLRIELEFSDDVHSVAEATFGGAFAARVDLRQMAVPVLLGDGRAPPAPAAISTAVSSGGAPVRVLAVDEGPADVVIVRDASAQRLLDRIARAQRGRGTALAPVSFRYAAHLRRNQRARLVSPFAHSRRSARYHYELFSPSGEFSADEGGLFWLLLTERPRTAESSAQRLADALGVAGMAAAARGRRRAVVLLLGDDPRDASQFSPAAIRGYLGALRVPLFVWSAAQPPAATAAGEWGEIADVSTLPRFERQVRELSRHLDRQRVLWLEGLHLPQRLSLDPGLSAFAFPM